MVQSKPSSSSSLKPKSRFLFIPTLLYGTIVIVSFTSGYLFKSIVLRRIPLFSSLITSQIEPNQKFQEGLDTAKLAATLTQTAIYKQDWETVTKHWESAIALLESVPPNVPEYELAVTKLSEYKTNLNYALNNAFNPPLFRNAVNTAMEAATQSQTATSSAEWQEVANLWETAIALLQAMTPSDPNYSTAQDRIVQYQAYLKEAQNKTSFVRSETQTPTSTQPDTFQQAKNYALEAANLAQKASSSQEWDKTASQWRQALTLLKSIPTSDPQYNLAQTKIATYQRNYDYAISNAKSPPHFRNGINAAMEAATRSQTARSKQQWQNVVQHWESAIASLKAIPENDANYAVAANKISEYQSNLDYAIEREKTVLSRMTLVKTITGTISPKSVVHSGTGLFFAQNMMYRHSITVYDRDYNLVKTLSDSVNLKEHGYQNYSGNYSGSPVEAAFSHEGKYAWVSNYQMYGKGFANPGSDRCSPAANHDNSFLYRINTNSLGIEKVIQVGSVPKFLATSPNNQFVIVTNWCSWDASIIDTQTNQEIKRIKLGAYPRGVVVDNPSENAYVAIMGSNKIAKINLQDFSVNWLNNIGSSPRHLVLDPDNDYLYASLNAEGRLAKIDLATGKVIQKVATGSAPRSMAISADGEFLYVVNYNSHNVSKVRTKDMKVIQTVSVNANPIGITYDAETQQVWVACYTGSIMVFQD